MKMPLGVKLVLVALAIALAAIFASRKWTAPPVQGVEPGQTEGDRLVLTIDGVAFPFRWAPAGEFLMGSSAGEEGRDQAEVRHPVVLSRGFWILETEVTQEMYAAVTKTNPSEFKGDNLPVDSVSWFDANAFCAEWAKAARLPSSIAARLPSEAEWEYACRAGTKTALPNGRDIKILGDRNAPALDGIAWYGGNSSVGYIDKGRGVDTSSWPGKQYPGGKAGTHPVRSKAANNWGLYDMLGNVWEWCDDWYGEDYYSRSPAADPSGPSSGSARVSRGGSWLNHARYCRPASRAGPDPGYRDPYLGLRVALVPVQ